MCEPVSLTLAAVAIGAGGASAGFGIAGQNTSRQLAKGMENQKRLAREEQINVTRVRATEDYIAKVRDENTLRQQETEALAEKTYDVQRSEVAAGATARVAAAEAGVAGVSLDQLVADYRMQADRETGRLNINQSWANAQHGRNITAYQREYQNRVEGVVPYQMQPQAPVDYFGPIFGAVGGAAQAGMSGYAPYAGKGSSTRSSS